MKFVKSTGHAKPDERRVLLAVFTAIFCIGTAAGAVLFLCCGERQELCVHAKDYFEFCRSGVSFGAAWRTAYTEGLLISFAASCLGFFLFAGFPAAALQMYAAVRAGFIMTVVFACSDIGSAVLFSVSYAVTALMLVLVSANAVLISAKLRMALRAGRAVRYAQAVREQALLFAAVQLPLMLSAALEAIVF